MSEDQQLQDPSAEQFDAEAAQAAEQFDAEAAKRARVVLEGGAGVDEDGVIHGDELVPGDGRGPILDHEKKILGEEAKRLMNSHNVNVGARDMSYEEAQAWSNRASSMQEASAVIEGTPGAAEAQLKLQKRKSEYTDRRDEAKRIADNFELKRKATLQDAREHYQANKKAYVAQAIEEANAAGHDINYGGHHFPKTTEQQPPQPEQSQRIIDEAQHDGNPEYIERHPNAVQDKAKAEEMAYASKRSEEAVVKHANDFVRYDKYARDIEEPDDKFNEELSEAETKFQEKMRDAVGADSSRGTIDKPSKVRLATAKRDKALDLATSARTTADAKADEAAQEYDRHLETIAAATDLKNGKMPSQEKPQAEVDEQLSQTEQPKEPQST